MSWQSNALPFHPKILFLESCFIPAYHSNLAKPPQAITVTYKVMILSMESHIYLLNILLRQVTDSFFIPHSIWIPQIQRVWPLLYGCNFCFSQCTAGPVTKVLILCDTFFSFIFKYPQKGLSSSHFAVTGLIRQSGVHSDQRSEKAFIKVRAQQLIGWVAFPLVFSCLNCIMLILLKVFLFKKYFSFIF